MKYLVRIRKALFHIFPRFDRTVFKATMDVLPFEALARLMAAVVKMPISITKKTNELVCGSLIWRALLLFMWESPLRSRFDPTWGADN